MESCKAWRLDTPIRKNSHFKWLMVGFWLATLLCMGLIFKLDWWQVATVLACSFLVVIVANWWRIRVIHLTQPNITNNKDKLWQIFIEQKHQNYQKHHKPLMQSPSVVKKNHNHNTSLSPIKTAIMWQGRLDYTKDFGYWVLLKFEVVEPFKRPLTLIIFKDQIAPNLLINTKNNQDYDNWRLLKTIARL